MGGGVSGLGNPGRGEGSRGTGNPGARGGSKTLAIRRGGVDFFWNNPMCQKFFIENKNIVSQNEGKCISEDSNTKIFQDSSGNLAPEGPSHMTFGHACA